MEPISLYPAYCKDNDPNTTLIGYQSKSYTIMQTDRDKISSCIRSVDNTFQPQNRHINGTCNRIVRFQIQNQCEAPAPYTPSEKGTTYHMNNASKWDL